MIHARSNRTARSALPLGLAVVAVAALALAALTPIASAQAPASGARDLVLAPSGDAGLARRHGAAVRDRASAALTARGLMPARGPAGCSDPDCAAELLSADAADHALAIALWGRGTTCERVAVTLVDGQGVAHGGEVAVAGGDLTAALDAAIAEALEHAASGGGSPLRVTGTPPGATITLDRIPWGAVPHEDRVPHGEHALAVSADGFVTDRRTITLGPEPVTVEVALTRSAPEAAPVPALAPTGAPLQTTSGGGDPRLLGLGAGLGGAGLALVGVGLYGFLAPESGAPMPPDFTYERASVAGSGTWLGVGAAAVTSGVVLLVLGATSRPSSAGGPRAGSGPRAVISF